MRKLILVLWPALLAAGMAYGQRIEADTVKNKPDSTKKEKPKKREFLPLEASRKIRIKSNEGSWISLDVSPDGRTIVFDLLGDFICFRLKAARPVLF